MREERGISQASIAQLLGISPGQLGNIESYKRAHKYTLKQIVSLCDKYDVEITDIFLLDNNLSNKDQTRMLIESIIKYQSK